MIISLGYVVATNTIDKFKKYSLREIEIISHFVEQYICFLSSNTHHHQTY